MRTRSTLLIPSLITLVVGGSIILSQQQVVHASNATVTSQMEIAGLFDGLTNFFGNAWNNITGGLRSSDQEEDEDDGGESSSES